MKHEAPMRLFKTTRAYFYLFCCFAFLALNHLRVLLYPTKKHHTSFEVPYLSTVTSIWVITGMALVAYLLFAAIRLFPSRIEKVGLILTGILSLLQVVIEFRRLGLTWIPRIYPHAIAAIECVLVVLAGFRLYQVSFDRPAPLRDDNNGDMSEAEGS
jgi:hypothetical protein